MRLILNSKMAQEIGRHSDEAPMKRPSGEHAKRRVASKRSAPTGKAANAAAAATEPSSTDVTRPSTAHAAFHVGQSGAFKKLLIKQQQRCTVLTSQPEALTHETRLSLFLQLFRDEPIEHGGGTAFAQPLRQRIEMVN